MNSSSDATHQYPCVFAFSGKDMFTSMYPPVKLRSRCQRVRVACKLGGAHQNLFQLWSMPLRKLRLWIGS